MHELSLLKSIVDTVTSLSSKDSFKSVKEITLEVGALSGVVKEALEFCYPIATTGSVLEGSSIRVIDIPITMNCLDCKTSEVIKDLNYRCSKCNSYQTEIITGKEFNLKSMEVE